MNVRGPLSWIGIDVRGIQVGAGVSDEAVSTLRRMAADYGVLVLRDQRLTPEQQVELTHRFGEVERLAEHSLGSPAPGIFRISNQGDGYDVGHYWHADGAQKPRPTELSMLYAVDVPASPPTHTKFLSARAAFVALPMDLKDAVAGRRLALPSKVKAPILRAHPLSGETVLFLPFRFPAETAYGASLEPLLMKLNMQGLPAVEGMSTSDSKDLLLRLVRHATSNETWQYTHTWKPGDLVIWDQASVYHHAEESNAPRVLHRTSIKGRLPAQLSEGQREAEVA